MSAQSVARWSAIPMSREEDEDAFDAARGVKRRRDSDREDDSDDMSIISRSPSPLPPETMDVDKYDEYVPGIAREVITVDTKIKSSNKGFAMLANLGWTEGQPLGLSPDARVEPVPFYVKRDMTGLGKTTQDEEMIETTVSQRRELDSERQQKETENQRRAREASVARRAAVQAEVTSTLRAFYCDVCDKQFQNVAQYDEHTNSYAHHHKIRFRDMQATQRAMQNTQEVVDARREKERRREEKEIRKMAKAAGIRLSKPQSAPAPSLSTPLDKIISDDVSSISSRATATESEVFDTDTHRKESDSTASVPPHTGWVTRAPSLTSASASSAAPISPRTNIESSQGFLNLASSHPESGPSNVPPLSLAPCHLSPAGDPQAQTIDHVSAFNAVNLTTAPPPLPKKLSKKAKDEAREKSRSGWQAFQRGGKR